MAPRRRVFSATIPEVPTVPPPPPGRKGAVRIDQWERWKLDGGAMVIYPPKKGGELEGMMILHLVPEAPPMKTARTLDVDVARASSLARRKS